MELETYSRVKKSFKFKQKLVWTNIFGLAFLHIIFLYRLFFRFPNIRLITFLWGKSDKFTTTNICNHYYVKGVFLGLISALGVSVDAHRLWTHRSYKAKLPLRIFLMLCFVISGQVCILMNSFARTWRNTNFSIHWFNGPEITDYTTNVRIQMEIHIMQNVDFFSRIVDGSWWNDTPRLKKKGS